MPMYTGAKQGWTRIGLWALGGALLGLLVGLALGWWVWPVKWVDTDPSDLREQHQVAYVQMVADSLAVNGDAHLAGLRLYELTESDEDWLKVSALVERAAAEREQAGDVAAALRLRRLAEIVQLPEVRTPAKTAPSSSKSPAARITLWLVGASLVLAALALAAWLVLRLARRPANVSRTAASPVDELMTTREVARARGGRGRGSPPFEGVSSRGLMADSPAAPVSEERALALDFDEEEDVWEELEEEDLQEEPLDMTLPTDLTPNEQPAPDARTLSEPISSPARALRSVATARARDADSIWGEFQTEYRLGDDDFYYAFTVESPEREFVGQCGIVIGDVLSAEQPQRVDAFDVWLFETQGSRTVTKVLASPYAFDDEAQQAKISRRGEMQVAQPGAALTLEGSHLRLTVTVSDCLYLPWRQHEEAVFSHLAVRMVVEPIR